MRKTGFSQNSAARRRPSWPPGALARVCIQELTSAYPTPKIYLSPPLPVGDERIFPKKRVFLQNRCTEHRHPGGRHFSAIGRANEECATILQDSKITDHRKAISEEQGAGHAAGQLDFTANSECSASKLVCSRTYLIINFGCKIGLWAIGGVDESKSSSL